MVIGEGEKMPAALIQVNFDFVKDWCKKHDINPSSNDELLKNNKLIHRIQKEVDETNKKFGHWEQIKKFELTPDIWSMDGGHLTPTMKMKRKDIKKKYLNLYNKIYNQ